VAPHHLHDHSLSVHGFRRHRGWGCTTSTRAMTRDEGSGDRTGGLLQRAACCAFCRTTSGHYGKQRGRGLAVWGGGVAQRRCAGHRPWRKWSSCWFPWESRAQGIAGCFGVLGKRETGKGVFLAGQGKIGARERCAGRRDCWPEMEFGWNFLRAMGERQRHGSFEST
jgi:hypothetical protein